MAEHKYPRRVRHKNGFIDNTDYLLQLSPDGEWRCVLQSGRLGSVVTFADVDDCIKRGVYVETFDHHPADCPTCDGSGQIESASSLNTRSKACPSCREALTERRTADRVDSMRLGDVAVPQTPEAVAPSGDWLAREIAATRKEMESFPPKSTETIKRLTAELEQVTKERDELDRWYQENHDDWRKAWPRLVACGLVSQAGDKIAPTIADFVEGLIADRDKTAELLEAALGREIEANKRITELSDALSVKAVELEGRLNTADTKIIDLCTKDSMHIARLERSVKIFTDLDNDTFGILELLDARRNRAVEELNGIAAEATHDDAALGSTTK